MSYNSTKIRVIEPKSGGVMTSFLFLLSGMRIKSTRGLFILPLTFVFLFNLAVEASAEGMRGGTLRVAMNRAFD